ncbi:uncharacterized protein EI90DRAFT_3046688, partial [Cantharellus anzutake]|uniref:uncharacterized protein n=1 Tax=Cantharellus anzutake TaxID=1750568 RepID=UPI001904D623
MVDVVAGIDLYDSSNEEVKPWMESVTKLSDNPLPHTKNPSRIDGSRKDFSMASAYFKV